MDEMIGIDIEEKEENNFQALISGLPLIPSTEFKSLKLRLEALNKTMITELFNATQLIQTKVQLYTVVHCSDIELPTGLNKKGKSVPMIEDTVADITKYKEEYCVVFRSPAKQRELRIYAKKVSFL